MTIASTRLPLAGAALGLIGPGATASDLDDRFASIGARLGPGVAAGLLDELLGLGVVQVARVDHEEPVHVLTSLGEQALAGAIAGAPSVQLTDLETLRTDLLSTIAHELRTPLTAVRTSVGLLVDETTSPTDEQRRRLLATIERNADRMQRLVGDILDLARFRAGGLHLQLRRFDAAELARDVVNSMRPLADARHQAIALDAPSPGPAVFGDHRRLEQALLNLVSNAQRFSPDGSEIQVEVTGDDECVRWRVADPGRGIPAEDRARLFERFFVGRNDLNAAREGVGLGLPTALAIAQAHGGTIDVESEVGRGSAFTLVVPAAGPPGVGEA